MNQRLVIRPPAEVDLSEARDWYEAQRPGLGSEFLTAVDECFERIIEFPESSAVEYKGVRPAGLRRFPYVVYYRLTDEASEILAVLHGGRNPRVWRTRV
ncbi:MAG: type II toxin-antitoxin system RelE/ParE family toxin [Planctomycetaceae bacterium]